MTRLLVTHLQGHWFQFDRKPMALCSLAIAIPLLFIFGLLEFLIGPRLSLFRWLLIPIPPTFVRVPLLILVAMLLVYWLTKFKWEDLGFRNWRNWNLTERSYFVQVMLLSNCIFGALHYHSIGLILSNPSTWANAVLVAMTQLGWGLYQELVYRGILQRALVSRCGAVLGILFANALFTFGPLHFYHFSNASPAPIFIGIFLTGLFFSVLFWRSGNLWIVGLMHGIGNIYI